MNVRYEVGRRGRGAVAKKVILQPRPSPSMCEIPLTQELLAVCLAFFGVQLKSLSLDVLFGGELGAVSVDVGNNPSISESDEGVVDKVAVD